MGAPLRAPSSIETRRALLDIVELATSHRRGSVRFDDQAPRHDDSGGYREAAGRASGVPRLDVHLRCPGDELGVMAVLLCVAAIVWIPWALEAHLAPTAILCPLLIGATLLVMATRSWGWCHVAIAGTEAVIRCGGRTHASDVSDVRVGGAPPHLTTGASGRIAVSDDGVSRLVPPLLAAYRAHLRALAAETRA